ncbi:MAG: Abi-alpha family protein [Solirubrobacterales bacterium]
MADDSHPRPRSRLGMATGIARLTVTQSVRTSLRAAEWGAGSADAARRRLWQAVRDGEPPDQLLSELTDDVLAVLRELIGVAELEDRVHRLSPRPGDEAPQGTDPEKPTTARILRDRGEELLRHSSRLGDAEAPHPAFALILEQLAPDEARILRLLELEGPQPIVDVLETTAFGHERREAALRVSLVAEQAGCRHVELCDAYLDNLERLGVIRIPHDPLEDETLYEVLEAQPRVSDLTSSGPSLKTSVRRSRLELSDLGTAFCAMCFPTDDSTGIGDSADAES